MNQEKLLQLEAYLDNELPPAESKKVAEWLAVDEKARAIYEELRTTKTLLAGNELELKLPESPDFYWSKIQREINRLGTSELPEQPALLHTWWFRLTASLAGAALVMALIITMIRPQVGSSGLAGYFQEIETPIEEASAISFHSQAAGMRVVWIQSQDN
jgi:anti-sigma factor RsiW